MRPWLWTSWSILGVASVGLGACTNDFDQFDPGSQFGGASASSTSASLSGPSSGPTTVGSVGSGGASTTASTTATASASVSSTGSAMGCASGFSCLPEAAAGQYAIAAASAAACPSGWTDATTTGDGVDPGCSACACGAPQGTCNAGTVHRRGASNCTGQQQTIGNSNDGECVDVTTGASGYSVEPGSANGGGCEPGASDPLPIPQGTLCKAQAGMACGAGMVCVPDSAAPFGGACNLLPGSASCPAEFPTKSTVYTSVNDTRNCMCACGDPQNAACTGAGIQLFAGDACGGNALLTIDADGACVDTSALDTNSSFLVEAGTWSSTGCAPQDASTGQVTFGGEATLCCAP